MIQKIIGPIHNGMKFTTELSPETALIKVVHDLLLGPDQGSASLLVLVGISAAFNSTDLTLLLDRLENVGIKETVLSWLKPWLI